MKDFLHLTYDPKISLEKNSYWDHDGRGLDDAEDDEFLNREDLEHFQFLEIAK